MNISDLIPEGKENSISRQYLLTLCREYGIAKSDREMRRLIQKERAKSCILNMQDGSGYFRPTKDDLQELRHYILQEKDRSMTILSNLRMAKNLLEDMEVGRV